MKLAPPTVKPWRFFSTTLAMILAAGRQMASTPAVSPRAMASGTREAPVSTMKVATPRPPARPVNSP